MFYKPFTNETGRSVGPQTHLSCLHNRKRDQAKPKSKHNIQIFNAKVNTTHL